MEVQHRSHNMIVFVRPGSLVPRAFIEVPFLMTMIVNGAGMARIGLRRVVDEFAQVIVGREMFGYEPPEGGVTCH
jgi:hypothetical protein